MDRGAWRATVVHGVENSWTWLSDYAPTTHLRNEIIVIIYIFNPIKSEGSHSPGLSTESHLKKHKISNQKS